MDENIKPFFTVPIKKEGVPVNYGTGAVMMNTMGRYNLGSAASSAATSSAATSSVIGAQNLTVHGRPVDIKPFMVEPTMDMLNDKSSPYNIDVETLVNLWTVRFGKEWVGNEAVDELEEDVDFWRHVANRLRDLGRMEMHTLASTYRVVLRIVE